MRQSFRWWEPLHKDRRVQLAELSNPVRVGQYLVNRQRKRNPRSERSILWLRGWRAVRRLATDQLSRAVAGDGRDTRRRDAPGQAGLWATSPNIRTEWLVVGARCRLYTTSWICRSFTYAATVARSPRWSRTPVRSLASSTSPTPPRKFVALAGGCLGDRTVNSRPTGSSPNMGSPGSGTAGRTAESSFNSFRMAMTRRQH
jgi:hypothetical protein